MVFFNLMKRREEKSRKILSLRMAKMNNKRVRKVALKKTIGATSQLLHGLKVFIFKFLEMKK